MKKLIEKPRAFVVVMVMALMMLLPTTSNAQSQTDEFFYAPDSYADRTTWEYWVINQQFGQNSDTPLGTGLLIMTVACAGYAVLKKREA
jgi:hypothetical protein